MQRPFPGMDPYLESSELWRDFHQSFLTYCRDALMDRMPANYLVRLDTEVRLTRPFQDHRERSFWADLRIHHRPNGAAQPGPAVATQTITPTATVAVALMHKRQQPRLEIRHQPGRELVTVIELLSPSNKVNPGRGEYLSKRTDLLLQPLNLVELDLLRGGKRLPMAKKGWPAGDYYAIVARLERRPLADVYAWTVRDPLPSIAVPLRAPDGDVVLDLGAVFAITWQRGRYGLEIDYRQPPPVPWTEAEAGWAAERLRTGPGTDPLPG